MANNEALFDEAVVEISPEFFDHLNFVDLGGLVQVQLEEPLATSFRNIVEAAGYQANWDADRTVLTVYRADDNDAVAQVIMHQVGDGDDYEFRIMGPDEVAVGELADMEDGGIMRQLFDAAEQLWHNEQENIIAAGAQVQPVAAPQAVAPVAVEEHHYNANMEMEGGRKRRRRRTMRRKARKTRKANRRRTVYRKRR